MTAVFVLLSLAAFLALLSLLPVGARVDYDETGVQVRLKLGPLSFLAYPRKAGKDKGKGDKTKPPKATSAKRGGSFALVRELLPLAADAAGELRRKIVVELFQMDLLWSDPDPARCALGFGAANAAMGALWPLVEESFQVKERRLRTAVDFDQGRPTVVLTVWLSLRVGQLLSFSLRLAGKGWKVWKEHQTAKKHPMMKTSKDEPIKTTKEAV